MSIDLEEGEVKQDEYIECLVHRKEGDEWKMVDFFDLKPGDRVRLSNHGQTPRSEFTATSEPYEGADGIGTIDCEDAIIMDPEPSKSI